MILPVKIYNLTKGLTQSILLRGARQLLTLRGSPGVRRGSRCADLEVIEDGSVFIKDGKIHAVGSTRRLENLKEARSAIQIPVHNCVVMPGFVDPWINLKLNTVAPNGRPRRRKLSEFAKELLTLLRSCLQHGTLTAGIKASSGAGSFHADISVLRQIALVGDNPIGLTRAWRPHFNKPAQPAALRESLSQIVRRGLANSIELDSDLESYLRVAAVGPPTLPFYLDWTNGAAGTLGAALDQIRPVSVFCRHNLAKGECKELAQSDAVTVFKAGHTLLDDTTGGSLQELQQAGGAVALGSGYDAVDEQNFNMQLVVALAVRRLNLTIEQAIAATTINAAYALNRGDELGSLEPGKRADVLILNINDYRELPRRLGVNHLAMAIRDGHLAINRTRWRVGAA